MPAVMARPTLDPVEADRLRRLGVHQRIFAVKIRMGDVSLDDALARFKAMAAEHGLTAALPKSQAPAVSG